MRNFRVVNSATPPYGTTPELAKHWADKSRVSEEEVARVIWNIRTFAHYFP